MTAIDDTILIDLSKCGGEGFLEMGQPSMRRRDNFRREALKKMATVDSNGKSTFDKVFAEDYQRILILGSVLSGPFYTDDATEAEEKFYQYTDMLYKKDRRYGEALYDEMIKAYKKITEGKASPFADSPAAVSQGSE